VKIIIAEKAAAYLEQHTNTSLYARYQRRMFGDKFCF